MKYDALIIGAGLSGLTTASLLAKRGLRVAVIEQAQTPGGACGIFKRNGTTYDQGAAMLYGFGEQGFNAHRFLFNCLEEPIQMIKHNLLYVVTYKGKRIRFFPDIDRFIEELSYHFPKEKNNIRRFYKDMETCYYHVISETPNYTTPDETDPADGLKAVLRHPLSYLRFLSYLNISAEKLLKKYFKDQDLLDFFSKLTSTYCYATINEAPAILASVMFVDNHVGGSYYPAGSTLFLPGKLEKVIEEHHGTMFYGYTATKLVFQENKMVGVQLNDHQIIYGDHVIYSGTVWNLYEKLLPGEKVSLEKRNWVSAQVPTYSSVVLYALVEKEALPADVCPIEMLASEGGTDETEITVYTLSLDDHTLCDSDKEVMVVIGPNFQSWNWEQEKEYKAQKEQEKNRLITLLKNRFPEIEKHLLYWELATPSTIEHFTLKNGGACAGPKQVLGQHMLKRQSIRTAWENLFVCGESTTMGTGTPTVTTSGIAAANAVLKKVNLPLYKWQPGMKNYVEVLEPPVTQDWQYLHYPPEEADSMTLAAKCNFCANPTCCKRDILDIPSIMRRVACGNFTGAHKVLKDSNIIFTEDLTKGWEYQCIRRIDSSSPVSITEIINFLISNHNQNI